MLLERNEELAAIEAAMDAAVEGNGSLLIAEGAAGIGKTELIRWTHARALDQGIDPLGARGGELEQSLAFGIVRQLSSNGWRARAPASVRSSGRAPHHSQDRHSDAG